ncbi:MAG: hypothetical protein ACTJLN_00050 [Rickettsia amblyommatis]
MFSFFTATSFVRLVISIIALFKALIRTSFAISISILLSFSLTLVTIP